MTPPRILFMGTPDFAVPVVRALSEWDGCDLVAVVTQPDKPAGRGQKLIAPPVKVEAERRSVPVLQPTKLKKAETHELLRSYQPDLAVVAAYGRILPQAVLDIPRLGCVNVHASLLPRHRGASPINHAILAGDAETGISIMQMDAGLDTGPVYRRDAIPIPPDATAGSLFEQLATLGAESLLAALPGILDGSLTAEPQDDALATYAPLMSKTDGHLDFQTTAVELERRVRGLHPWPGAYALRGDAPIKVLRAHVAEGSGTPGVVLRAGKEGVVVACREGALCLDDVQPAGRKKMSAAAWVAGRGISTGDSFTSPARAPATPEPR